MTSTNVTGLWLVGAMCRIIIADRQELYRAGIIALVAGSGPCTVIAECPDWSSLVEAVGADAGSVVIASLCLVADIEDLIARAEKANSRVLLVAEDSDSLNCYRSTGAAGIVHRSASASTFLETLRKIRMGADFVLAAEGRRRLELGRRLAASLTPGELKILALLLEGCKNRLIAEYLNVAEHVVRSSFQKIFDKTGFSNRVELALFLSRGMQERSNQVSVHVSPGPASKNTPAFRGCRDRTYGSARPAGDPLRSPRGRPFRNRSGRWMKSFHPGQGDG